MTKSNKKKSNKKTKKSKERRHIPIKKIAIWGFKVLCITLIVSCLLVITLPYFRNYILKIYVKRIICETIYKDVTLESAYINFWDLSLNINNLSLQNPLNYPKEFATHVNHIQIKPLIHYPFSIRYNLCLNQLGFNLYYLPEKGTNLGNLYTLLCSEVKENSPSIFNMVQTILVNRAIINISQNLEPEQYNVNKSLCFSKEDYPTSLSNCNLILLEQILRSYIIENNEIPVDFRQSLITEIDKNKI